MSATAVAARCAISRLRLFRFRNYAGVTVAFGDSLNVIAGANAQGKTNLLEAAATLALTRSPRAASSADLLMWGADAAAVEGAVARPGGDRTLSVHLERTGDGERVTRSTTVDGKARAARAVLGLCPVVMFWPDDLQLVKAGPDARRRLLDVLLAQLQPRTAAHMSRYRRVLEQRNALLHRFRLEGRSGPELDGFTQELAHHGARIAVARATLLQELAPLAAGALRDLSGGSEDLTLHYLAAHGQMSSDAEGTEADLLAALRARSAEELARGVTVAGPHRDDVSILLDGRPARTAASQGQQRSVVLALKLAEMRHVRRCTGASPVVMLDDVLSELDRNRRAQLLAMLTSSGGAQVLVTTTEPLADLDTAAGVRHFRVVDGTVDEES
ncbi:MAG TPA: DNA replication/repair protein RecF [Candidatus Dormibacteraeota bacterium]